MNENDYLINKAAVYLKYFRSLYAVFTETHSVIYLLEHFSKPSKASKFF